MGGGWDIHSPATIEIGTLWVVEQGPPQVIALPTPPFYPPPYLHCHTLPHTFTVEIICLYLRLLGWKRSDDT